MKDYFKWWFAVGMELQKFDPPIPMALETQMRVRFGWGGGWQTLILPDGRITLPSGEFIPLSHITAGEFAKMVRGAMRLSKTERKVLDKIRDGQRCYGTISSRMVVVESSRLAGKGVRSTAVAFHRRSLIDRLISIGLVNEVASENSTDIEFIAVQPASVRPYRTKGGVA